jgi:hypothetical protein
MMISLVYFLLVRREAQHFLEKRKAVLYFANTPHNISYFKSFIFPYMRFRKMLE